MKKITLITVLVLSLRCLYAQEPVDLPYVSEAELKVMEKLTDSIFPKPPRFYENHWDSAFLSQKLFIEEKTGMKFDSSFVPTVQFGLPDYISDSAKKGINGVYDASIRSFWIRPILKRRLGDTSSVGRSIPGLSRHELGHALTHQISLRKNGYSCFDTTNVRKHDLADEIIFEGIAEYFNKKLSNDSVADSEYLPGGSTSHADPRKNWRYNGGYWLVKTIIDQFGEKGIAYLARTKFTYEGENLREGAYEYQRKAFKELKKAK